MRVAVQYSYFYTTGEVRPSVEVEDSRRWPLKRHARIELEGTESWVRPGQPAIAASAIARIEGAAAVVDTGIIRGISSTVVALQGTESILRISSLRGQARSEVRMTGSETFLDLGSLGFKGVAVVELLGTEARVRSGYVSAVIGPDLEVLEDEELLFLLEVA